MKPEPHTKVQDEPEADPCAWLSALKDGDGSALEPACAHWRNDAYARAAWHAYHLIGDVMRSEELARPAAHDAAFLQGVRARLLAEPVVLAPAAAPAVSAMPRRRPWLLPVAAAAGFVMVAGVLVVTRVSLPGAPLSAAPQQAVAQQELIRDPIIDDYVRAHRQVRGGVAVAAPGGTLRPVYLTVPAAPER